MNSSELETIWREQSLRAPDVTRIALLVDNISAEDRKFRRQIWWRDFREIAAAVSVALFLSLMGRTWLSWFPVACALFVAAYLLRSKLNRQNPAVVFDLTAKVRQRLDEVETQIALLRTVFWWYLLPCIISIGALTAEALLGGAHPRALLFPLLLCLIVFVAVYCLNRWYVAKRLEPRRCDVQQLLSELEGCPD